MHNNYQVHYFGNTSSKNIFIQPIDEHDFSLMESEVSLLKEMVNNEDFLVVAFLIKDWNKELTPWESEPVFGKVPFGNNAKETLSFILNSLIPSIEKEFNSKGKRYYLCGYSLAGLFALWSAYQSDIFSGIGAISPSIWYPNWIKYAEEHEIKTKNVYLSLGDKEEKAKNPIMATVGQAIRKQYEILISKNINTILEWNPGNHFIDSDKRTAKGMSWLLNNKTNS